MIVTLKQGSVVVVVGDSVVDEVVVELVVVVLELVDVVLELVEVEEVEVAAVVDVVETNCEQQARVFTALDALTALTESFLKYVTNGTLPTLTHKSFSYTPAVVYFFSIGSLLQFK